MNPYQPPDDKSQLDRIERKLDRLDGSYLQALILWVALGVSIVSLIEYASAWWHGVRPWAF